MMFLTSLTKIIIFISYLYYQCSIILSYNIYVRNDGSDINGCTNEDSDACLTLDRGISVMKSSVNPNSSDVPDSMLIDLDSNTYDLTNNAFFKYSGNNAMTGNGIENTIIQYINNNNDNNNNYDMFLLNANDYLTPTNIDSSNYNGIISLTLSSFTFFPMVCLSTLATSPNGNNVGVCNVSSVISLDAGVYDPNLVNSVGLEASNIMIDGSSGSNRIIFEDLDVFSLIGYSNNDNYDSVDSVRDDSLDIGVLFSNISIYDVTNKIFSTFTALFNAEYIDSVDITDLEVISRNSSDYMGRLMNIEYDSNVLLNNIEIYGYHFILYALSIQDCINVVLNNIYLNRTNAALRILRVSSTYNVTINNLIAFGFDPNIDVLDAQTSDYSNKRSVIDGFMQLSRNTENAQLVNSHIYNYFSIESFIKLSTDSLKVEIKNTVFNRIYGVNATDANSGEYSYSFIEINNELEIIIDNCNFYDIKFFRALIQCEKYSYCTINIKNSNFMINSGNTANTIEINQLILLEDDSYATVNIENSKIVGCESRDDCITYESDDWDDNEISINVKGTLFLRNINATAIPTEMPTNRPTEMPSVSKTSMAMVGMSVKWVILAMIVWNVA